MEVTVAQKDLQKRRLLLEGNILRGVLSVCVPMAAFQLLNELFRVFDLAITARINPETVSAVSFYNQLANSVASVGIGLSIGAGILIAGYYGAGEYEKVKCTVNTTFFLAGTGGILLAAGLIAAGRPVLRLANTPPELIRIGWEYYRLVILDLVLVFFNNVYIAIEKARGNGSRILAEKFAFSAGKVMVNSVGVDYGTQTVGALGVSNSISALSTVPAGSIGDGGAAVIRQNIGSGKLCRALRAFRVVFAVDMVWGVFGFLVTWALLDPILSVFSGGDASFAGLIREIFVLEMLSNVFLSAHAAVMALLYAFGYTRLSFCVNFSRLFVFRLPILLLLRSFTALPGGTAMGVVMMVSNGLTGIFALILAGVVLRREYGPGWLGLVVHNKAGNDEQPPES